MQSPSVAGMTVFLLLEVLSFVTLAVALAASRNATERRRQMLAAIEGAERLAAGKPGPLIILYVVVTTAVAAVSAFLYLVQPHLL